MQIERAKAFCLPDGAFVKVELYEDDHAGNSKYPMSWKALDISLIGPDGHDEILCSIDLDDQKGLRTLVFDKDKAEPVFERYIGYGPEEKR